MKRCGLGAAARTRAMSAVSLRLSSVVTVILAVAAGLLAGLAASAQIPATDRRNAEIRHTNRVYELPEYTREEWEERAQFLRKQVQFASGLLPMPPREPLNPRRETVATHQDYAVENVLLETYPGYFLGGNLYRPVGKSGPFPAIVSPHGHWRYGRLENSALGSVPARAITFARQGYVVFAYDMVGWNDTMQVPHGFAGPREELWLLGSLGLQLWNSLRVVDFLESLLEVDASRIGATGASGGGTQVFLLAAVDSRIRYNAPVNMVSFQMQGGSRCENAPLLRIGTNNVEIAALFAPKPQMLVAATGDWTVNMPRDEFPAVQRVYRLLDAESNVESEQFDSPHNYHQDSREAVYRFFGSRILGQEDKGQFKERSYRPENPSSLLYLWGRSLPDGAVGFEEFLRQRIAAAESDTGVLSVTNGASLDRARDAFRERLSLALLAEVPAPELILAESSSDGNLLLGRDGAGDRVPARLSSEATDRPPVLLVHPDGREAALQSGLAKALASAATSVLAIDAFQTGEAAVPRDLAAVDDSAERYYHVFNRSDDANRIQDILTAAAYLRKCAGVDAVAVAGEGRAGLWVSLAAAIDPGIDRVAADLSQFDATDDAAYVAGLMVPGLRRAGDFRAVASLTSDRDVLLHNAHAAFPTGAFQQAFDAAGRSTALQLVDGVATAEQVSEWLVR